MILFGAALPISALDSAPFTECYYKIDRAEADGRISSKDANALREQLRSMRERDERLTRPGGHVAEDSMWHSQIVAEVQRIIASLSDDKPNVLLPRLPVATIAKRSLADVDQVSVEKIGDRLFRISAQGLASSTGWTINLHSRAQKDDSQLIVEAVAIPPTGPSGQVVSPWHASIQLSLAPTVKYVTVRGQRVQFKKDVPW